MAMKREVKDELIKHVSGLGVRTTTTKNICTMFYVDNGDKSDVKICTGVGSL